MVVTSRDIVGGKSNGITAMQFILTRKIDVLFVSNTGPYSTEDLSQEHSSNGTVMGMLILPMESHVCSSTESSTASSTYLVTFSKLGRPVGDAAKAVVGFGGGGCFFAVSFVMTFFVPLLGRMVFLYGLP